MVTVTFGSCGGLSVASVHWYLESMLNEQCLVSLLACCGTFREMTLLFPVQCLSNNCV